jgi:HEAT repeat protein
MSRRRIYILLPCLLLPLICFLVIEGCGADKSTEELIEDLKSGNEKDRITAVRTLQVSSEDAEKIVPTLIVALKDKDGDVRRSAAIKLGLYGEQAREAIPALKFALNDRDARVRRAAADALAKIDPNSVPKGDAEKASGQ